jgi:glycosyltransferase involved in cell wall biosynthesis
VLAILTTHPIQYQVPLWQALAQDGRVPFEVWYLTRHGVQASHDREFGKSFAWDLDMLSGYPHRFLDVHPGATPNTFWKCRLRESLGDRLRASGAKALWVQGWQVSAYWQAVWAAKQMGVEVWLRAESNDLAPTRLWKRGIKRLILGQFLRRVDRFLCIGTANRRLYQQYGVQDDRLYSAPYAVDNERFARQAEQIRKQPGEVGDPVKNPENFTGQGGLHGPGPSEVANQRLHGPGKAEIRKAWGIPEDAFCVLFCGKFIPKKRPMDLVEALAIAGSQRSEVRGQRMVALFVGSGELGAQLRSACNVVFDAEAPGSSPRPSTLDPRPMATFAGFLNQTEISRAYVAADCLVLPSDYGETWGLVVNEAMASGLPCIISDRCGCAEDLGSSGPNLVFPGGGVAALTDRLLKMASRPDSAVRPASVRQPPSLDETVATVISLYEDGR